MAHDVFISYSHRDKAVADAICARLEGARIRCWYAPRNIAPGETWAGAIPQAIRDARIFVLVFTDSANTSEQVTREVNLAVSAGLTIIPYRLTRAEPSGDMGYYLGPVHWLDAMDDKQARAIQRLLHRCQAILRGEAVPLHDEEERAGASGRKKLLLALGALIVAAAAAVACVFLLQKPAPPADDASTTPAPEAAFESAFDDSLSCFPDLNAGVGDIVTFGRYILQRGEDAEPEALTWRVLERGEDSLLLISEYVLEAKPFNTAEQETCWAECSLRQWLNEDFPRLAFTQAEYACLVQSEVTADANFSYTCEQGADTIDRVFLLSAAEAENRYFKNDADRRTRVTPRVMALPNPPIHTTNKTAFWWLRTMGSDQWNATFVSQSGTVMTLGDMAYMLELGVRPVVRVNVYSVIAASGLTGSAS